MPSSSTTTRPTRRSECVSASRSSGLQPASRLRARGRSVRHGRPHRQPEVVGRAVVALVERLEFLRLPAHRLPDGCVVAVHGFRGRRVSLALGRCAGAGQGRSRASEASESKRKAVSPSTDVFTRRVRWPSFWLSLTDRRPMLCFDRSLCWSVFVGIYGSLHLRTRGAMTTRCAGRPPRKGADHPEALKMARSFPTQLLARGSRRPTHGPCGKERLSCGCASPDERAARDFLCQRG